MLGFRACVVFALLALAFAAPLPHETDEAHDHGDEHFHGAASHTHEVDGVIVYHDHAHVDGDDADEDAHRKKREAHETGEAHEHGDEHFHGSAGHTHEVDGVVVHHDHAHVDGDEADNDAHRKKREAHEADEAHDHGDEHFHGSAAHTHEVDGVIVYHDHAHVDGDDADEDAHRRKREAHMTGEEHTHEEGAGHTHVFEDGHQHQHEHAHGDDQGEGHAHVHAHTHDDGTHHHQAHTHEDGSHHHQGDGCGCHDDE